VVFSGSHDGANVAMTSYVLSPAACNAWYQPVDGDFDNRPHPGLGCVVNRNLYLMIADPRDLVSGRATE
jgi:pilus assembly protein CpaD